VVAPTATYRQFELSKVKADINGRLNTIEAKLDHLQDSVLSLIVLLSGSKK